MYKKQDRLFLDFVKGILIFIMIWAHVLQYCLPKGYVLLDLSFIKFIHSFNMPLFMMISGYLFYITFEKRKLKELIAHRSKPLIFTIVFYGIFHYLVTYGVLGIKNANYNIFFKGNIFNITFTSWFWFLWAVLASSLIVAIVCKTFKNIWIQIPFLVCGLIISYMFPTGDLVAWVYPFYILGFYFAKYKQKFKKVEFLKYIMILVFPILICFNKMEYSPYSFGFVKNSLLNSLYVNLYRWLLGISASITVLTLLKIVYDYIIKKILNRNKKPVITLCFAELGKNSLLYYVISVTLVSFWLYEITKKIYNILPAINDFFAKYFILYNYAITPIIALVYCVVIFFIIKFLDYIKVSCILFGRNVEMLKNGESNELIIMEKEVKK